MRKMVTVICPFPRYVVLLAVNWCFLFIISTKRRSGTWVGSAGSHPLSADHRRVGELVSSVRPVRSDFTFNGVNEVRLCCDQRKFKNSILAIKKVTYCCSAYFVEQVAGCCSRAERRGGAVCPTTGADQWSGGVVSNIPGRRGQEGQETWARTSLHPIHLFNTYAKLKNQSKVRFRALGLTHYPE